MVKVKSYKNLFGNTSFILIDRYFCRFNGMEHLIDIFKPSRLLTSITALSQYSNYYKYVSDEKKRFNVIYPPGDKITSNTLILSETDDFLLSYDLLLESEPRCITLFGLNKNLKILHSDHKEFHNDDILVAKGIVDYVISIILEENCVKITYNSDLFDSVNLFKIIKKKFEGL